MEANGIVMPEKHFSDELLQIEWEKGSSAFSCEDYESFMLIFLDKIIRWA